MTKSRVFLSAISLVVIALIAYLTFTSMFSCGHNAFETKARSDVYMLGKTIELYKQDKNSYPDSLETLLGVYLYRIPKDPWGYRYEYISDGNKAIILTHGDPNSEKPIYHVAGKKI